MDGWMVRKINNDCGHCMGQRRQTTLTTVIIYIYAFSGVGIVRHRCDHNITERTCHVIDNQ